MDEQNYSKRELDHNLGDIKDTLAKQDLALSKILEQTTKHNGRLSRVEFWQSAIIWVFVTVVLPVAFIIFNKYII